MDYKDLILSLKNEYGLVADPEHEFIHEFSDGGIPLFKLLAGQKEDESGIAVIVCFHVELDIPSAIAWYVKIKDLAGELYLTTSYVKDEDGETLLGQSAEIYRYEMIEKLAIEKVKREIQLVTGEEAKPETSPTFRDFDNLQPKKGQRFS